METLKTIGVLVVLLVVGYLGYKAVTNPPVTPPNETPTSQSPTVADATNVNIPIPELPPGMENQSADRSAKTSSLVSSPIVPPASSGGQVPTASLTARPNSSSQEVAAQISNSGDLEGGLSSGQKSPDLSVIPPQPVVGSSFSARPSTEGAVPPIASPMGDVRSGALSTSGPAPEAESVSSQVMSENAVTAPSPSSAVRPEFANFLEVACQKLDRGEFAQVHQVLSAWYADPRLTPEEDAQLTDLLDQVAGTVVYSRQHILEPPYTVQPGDTLPQIAERFAVPWQLLAKINGITQSDQLSPGMQLKVVRGPFEAIIRLQRRELVLMVQGRYAGRFSIGLGRDAKGCEGVYQVREKTLNPRYYSDQGVIEANDPRNPLGAKWLGLEGRLGIHAARDPRSFQDPEAPGAIFLSPQDMDDVFDILDVGSRVVITP